MRLYQSPWTRSTANDVKEDDDHIYDPADSIDDEDEEKPMAPPSEQLYENTTIADLSEESELDNEGQQRHWVKENSCNCSENSRRGMLPSRG